MTCQSTQFSGTHFGTVVQQDVKDLNGWIKLSLNNTLDSKYHVKFEIPSITTYALSIFCTLTGERYIQVRLLLDAQEHRKRKVQMNRNNIEITISLQSCAKSGAVEMLACFFQLIVSFAIPTQMFG